VRHQPIRVLPGAALLLLLQRLSRGSRGSGGAVGRPPTERASQPGSDLPNVTDVDETPIKIAIADTLITADRPRPDATSVPR
jgi:hypothetical protein